MLGDQVKVQIVVGLPDGGHAYGAAVEAESVAAYSAEFWSAFQDSDSMLLTLEDGRMLMLRGLQYGRAHIFIQEHRDGSNAPV